MTYDRRLKPVDLNPFIDANAPTFYDAIARITTDTDLTPARRRDLVSAIRCLMRLLELDPNTTPASLGALRPRLEQIHPAQAAISEKRFGNIKSDVKFALRHLGLTTSIPRHVEQLRPAWQTLWGTIKDDQTRWKLSRLFRFCSALEINPENVGDVTIERLHRALVEESFVKDPETTVRQTIYAWNRASRETDGWPPRLLSKRANRHEGWTFPLQAFPESFRNDLDRWLSRLRGDDPLADDAVPRPLRPATLDHRAFQIRMFASALVRRNVPVGRITGLAVLAEIENFKEALRFMLGRNDDQPTEAIYGCAMAIKAIATHHVKVSPEHLEELRRICSRIKVKIHGLRDKNRRRLRQFDDPANISEFLLLPARLEGLAKRARGRKAAVLMQMAVAVEILTMCPLRIGNLANLRLGETLFWTGPGRKGRLLLSIPSDEVKNREPIEFELPEESAQLVARYLDEYRTLLCGGNPGEWIFPGRDGGPKRPGSLGLQLKRIVYKHTGLEVNAHLMRHIGAKIHLDLNPGSYEVVRRVLGHRTIDTTTAFYTGFETKAAARHFDEVILEQRRTAVPTKIRRRRNKLR
ncbi:MAG: tyrosine-type recombinase/integrase [Acidiferrobacterales bacterium]